MDFTYAPELHFQPIQTSTEDGFSQPPPQLVDDFGITAENVDRYAAELDLELLREFFGSSLGEDVAKEARADDSESQTEASPPAPPSFASSTASSSSPASSSSSTVPSAGNGRKRKAAQDRFCVNCKTPKSSMWRRDPEGNTLCNACGQHLKKFKVHRPAAMFDRPIKKRCRKIKEEAPPARWIQASPNYHFNFGTVQPFQPQPQQIPPQYHYYQQPQPIQPQFQMQTFQQPPPEAYCTYNNWQHHPSYPLPPYFEQGQW